MNKVWLHGEVLIKKQRGKIPEGTVLLPVNGA